MAVLGDARAVAARVVAAVLLVVVAGGALYYYGSVQDERELAELRELAEADEGAAAPDLPGSLFVRADYVGSAVYVDGDSVGTTPIWVETVSEGARRVRVVGPDGGATDTTVTVVAGEMAELELTARPAAREPEQPVAIAANEPDDDPPARARRDAPAASRSAAPARPATGELRVTSSPSGAVVRLDGRRVGTTPVTLEGVRPGTRAVALVRRGYETATRQIEIRPGVEFEVAADLRPVAPAASRPAAPTPRPPAADPAPVAQGTIEVLVRPWGRIEIDGMLRARETDVVHRVVLPAGPHRVTVSHPQLGTREETVTVQPGGVARIEFNLASDSGRP